MKQLDRFWTELEPFLAHLSPEEKDNLTISFNRAQKGTSLLESNYHRAIRDRAAVHALLKRSSEDLLQRYQVLFENSGTATVVIEDDGTISLANTLFLNLLGYNREDVENRKNIFTLFIEPFQQKVRDYHRRRRTGDKTVPHRYEAQILTRAGETLDVIIMVGMFLGTRQSVVSFIDITEQKRTEEELADSKEYLNHIFSSVKAGIMVVDAATHEIINVNTAAAQMIGRDEKEIIGKICHQYVCPAQRGRCPITDLHISVDNAERMLITANGRQVPIIKDVIPVTLHGRKCLVESFIDNTERRQTEDELRMFKISADRAYDEIFWLDFEGNMLYVNASAKRNTGYSDEDLLSMKIFELDPDFNMDVWKGFIKDLRENGSMIFETRHRRKDGSIMDIEITANYVKKGESEFSFAFARDITERKRTQDELSAAHEQLKATEQELRQQFDKLAASQALLEESEAKFHGVFNNASDGIFMHLIKDGIPDRFLEVNDAMCTALGYTREELLTMTVRDILPEAQLKAMSEIGKTMSKMGHNTFYSEYRRKDGSVAPVEVNSRVYQFSGRVVVLSVARDITERKRAEQELIKKNDELEAAYEQLSAVEQELRINYANLSETEKKLRESEAWSREFTELLPQFVYETDTDGRLLFVNQYAAEVFGITRDMLDKGLNMRDVVIPEEWELVKKNLAGILRGKKTTRDIYHFRRKEGSLMPVNIFTAPVYRDGTLKGFRGIVVDITDSLMAQEAIQKSESRFRELAELLPQIVFELDENLKFTYFNWSTIDLTGYVYDELSKKKTGIYDILQESYHQPVEHFFARVLRERTTGHLECVMVNQDGKEIPAIIYASPIISENRISGIRGVIVDISEQKTLELAIRESERRFRELAELIPQFIFETDRNFRFIYSNLGALKVTGYSPEDFTQRLDVLSLVDISDRPPVRESFERVLRGEDVPPLQVSLMKNDQDKVPVIMYITPIVRENEYAGIRGIIVDISDQKRLEMALATTNQKLNMMNNLTRHDVLNNITGLLGLVDMLGEMSSDSNAQVLIAEIHELIITIKDQIVFTRDYQSVGVKAPQWQSLCQGIKYAASTIGLDTVLLKMPETDAEIFADPFFGRVFYNLIDNSFRHGGSVRNISIDTEVVPEGGLLIRYCDDGIGVNPDEKKLIFEQGYGKNTGFGLFIIREILGITGLTIQETGIFRRGVRFEILVPKGAWRPIVAKECTDCDQGRSV